MAALAVWLLWAGVNGGFIFDDKPNITQNGGLYMFGLDHYSLLRAAQSFPGSPGLRPLSMMSLGLDHFWAESFDPVIYKTTNLVIHAITVLALAAFVRLLLSLAGLPPRRAAWGALGVTLLWAIHPLQVSSVLYVVQRMQTLSTLFTVLALWAYLTMRQTQIQDLPSKKMGVWVLVFWGLGLASKEDAILLPLLTLGLELTVLRFAAANGALAANWRRAYAFLTLVGGLLFAFWVLPHYWRWEPYPGRDFSTPERLLTQGRVLVLYLGQIFWPLPERLPFYYDDFLVSRSLWQPLSTFWCLLLLLLLAGLGVWLRRSRPLFALGVWLFFAGHFITSNVAGLELVFEHRNHLPLIGVALAVGDVLLWFLRTPQRIRLGLLALVVPALALGGATLSRATIWGDALRLAQSNAEFAPYSARAWGALCRVHYDLSAGKASHPHFDLAIQACEQGGRNTGSAMALANVVILKTIRGDVTQSDWDVLLERLQTVTMNVENRGIAANFVRNSNWGTALDPQGVLAVIRIINKRTGLAVQDYVDLGFFILRTADDRDEAFGYFQRAIRATAGDTVRQESIFKQLASMGRQDWVAKLKQSD